MLTGRESLLRIIGKRRRFLPNRRSILSSISPSVSSDCKDAESEKNGVVDERFDESVGCPICGTQLPSQDNMIINSHLDKCLARGSKRKLGQLTLFQLNFSRSKIKVHDTKSEDEGSLVIASDLIKGHTYDLVYNSNEIDKSEEFDYDQEESTSYSVALAESSSATRKVNPFFDHNFSNEVVSQSLFSEIEKSKNVMEEHLDDADLSSLFIPTFIVGRRFGIRQDLDIESRICLSRDPENVKDSNAIKVIFAEYEQDNSLGFLPRELAQYLSPLIDTFHLNFQARIISVPKSSSAPIPIHIECNNLTLCDGNYSDKCQDFKSLCRNALRAAKLAKNGTSGMTRYQQNLALLIEEVLKNSPHIFTSSEKYFLEAFVSLPDDSQRLFARLYTRKGPWFRMSNLSYPEIADCDQAIKRLLEEGCIVSFPWTNELEDNVFEEVLDVLNVDELREASCMLKKKCRHGIRKNDIIDLLVSSCKDGLRPELESFVLATTGACVRISPLAESLIWRAERLFFLNGEQDISAFLLVDLGIVKYPVYKCIISEHIFPHMSDLLSYEEAIEIGQIMDESLSDNNSKLVFRCIDISVSRMSISSEEAKSTIGGTRPTFFLYFSASWIYSKVVLLGVSFLEYEKRYSEAIHLLRKLLDTFIFDRRRGYWNLRLSVDLEHLGRLDDSLQVAEDGLQDPYVCAGSRIALQRRVLRLGKPPRRWKIPSYSKFVKMKINEVNVQGRPLNCKIGAKSIFYGEDGEQCGVEQLALQYYAGEGGGWQGVHTESGIWLTLFGILMWDVIFADVPNVFWTKFQTAPLDLDTDSFYEARKNLIGSLLKKIHEGIAEEILITSWESHVGTACRGVNWEKHSLSELRKAVICIGGPCLSAICRHLAQDYRSWSSGMPDLVLWRLHDCYRGEAKLVEVKGPRDRLSEQQRAWLLVLMECGFRVEVCKVTPAVETVT